MLRVTITRVMMEPGATSQRHWRPKSEQTWIVEQGSATLLLVDGKTEEIRAGDVVRTPAGEVHGVRNSGAEPFVYLTITTPPQISRRHTSMRTACEHPQPELSR